MCCIECKNSKPSYVFGSAVITIVIGALTFITALAWNSYVQQTFEEYSSTTEELRAKLSYAFLVTAIAIVLGFLIMYYVEGSKW